MKKLLLSFALSASLVSMLAPAALADHHAAAASPDHRGLVVKFYDEVMNQNKLDMADKYFAKNAIDHDVPLDASKSVVENLKLFLGMMRTGFPDMNIKVEDAIIQGDKIVLLVRLKGTNTGEFMGMKATNKPINLLLADVFRIADGKFVEHWSFMDSGLLMQQLGMMPH